MARILAFKRASGQVGASNAACKERVSGDKSLLFSEIEADAAFGMAGRVDNFSRKRPCFRGAAMARALINLNFARRCHADPCGLLFKHLQKGIVIFIQEDGRSCGSAQLHRPAHVVYMGMSDEDLFDGKAVLVQNGEYVLNVIPGINDDGFACVSSPIMEQLPQRSHWENFVDHGEPSFQEANFSIGRFLLLRAR